MSEHRDDQPIPDQPIQNPKSGASGISNRPLEEETKRQERLPERGSSRKPEESAPPE